MLNNSSVQETIDDGAFIIAMNRLTGLQPVVVRLHIYEGMDGHAGEHWSFVNMRGGVLISETPLQFVTKHGVETSLETFAELDPIFLKSLSGEPTRIDLENISVDETADCFGMFGIIDESEVKVAEKYILESGLFEQVLVENKPLKQPTP